MAAVGGRGRAAAVRTAPTGHPLARAGLGIALALLSACAPVVNFEDPAGPRFGTNDRTERTGIGAATPDRITVVTFNIKYGRAIDKAIEVLRATPLRSADVISLQEVSAEGVARIARALHMEYVFYPAAIHPVEGTHFGAALLSGWPIERDWKVVLPHRSRPRNQQRVATAAVLRLGDARVRVYAVHMEIPLIITPPQRDDQVEHLLCDAGDATEPVVIAGDFNGSDVAWLLRNAGYAWATRDVGPSLHFLPVDHVFARALEPVASGTVANVRGASDHRPVWATLRLPAAATGAAPAPRHCDPPRRR